MRTRSGLMAGSLLLYALGSVAGTGGVSGLWAPTVCVSPAVFGAALILPPETIVDAARKRLDGEQYPGNEDSNTEDT